MKLVSQRGDIAHSEMLATVRRADGSFIDYGVICRSTQVRRSFLSRVMARLGGFFK